MATTLDASSMDVSVIKAKWPHREMRRRKCPAVVLGEIAKSAA